MTLKDMDNFEIADAIDRYVRGERDRQILKRRILDKICYEPLAEEFQLSVSQIKRIIIKAQEQLYYHLEKEEKGHES